jgi:hypothetical protein
MKMKILKALLALLALAVSGCGRNYRVHVFSFWKDYAEVEVPCSLVPSGYDFEITPTSAVVTVTFSLKEEGVKP